MRIAGGRWARLIELVVLSLLIGKLLGIESLGAWTFAMSAVILPLGVIAIPIGEVLFSAFSRMRGDHERIAIVWLESIGLLAAVLFPLLAGLIVVAPDLIPLAFGQHWSVAVPILQILSIYVIIRSLQAWNSVVLDAAGKPQITMWTQAAALCLTPVAVVVGSHWGIEAVAVCVRRRPADRGRDSVAHLRPNRAADQVADRGRPALGRRDGCAPDGSRLSRREARADLARLRGHEPCRPDDCARFDRVPGSTVGSSLPRFTAGA